MVMMIMILTGGGVENTMKTMMMMMMMMMMVVVVDSGQGYMYLISSQFLVPRVEFRTIFLGDCKNNGLFLLILFIGMMHHDEPFLAFDLKKPHGTRTFDSLAREKCEP